ncbi:MAG: lactonase family protein [Planctomycetia bacterium]|nr:lactonase family protein [Planctomycetia bacterium]
MKVLISLLACGLWAGAVWAETEKDAEMKTLYIGTANTATGNPDIAPSEGVYRLEMNLKTGELTFQGLAAAAKSPTFIVKHPTREVFYAVASNEDGTSKEGLVVAWKRLENGNFERLNTANSGGLGACHIAVHPSGKWLFVSNYSSGQFSFFSLDDDGRLGKLEKVFSSDSANKGPNAVRQNAAHAHFMMADPSGKFAIGCDLGCDRVYSWKLENGTWIENPERPFVTTASGAGPRHADFAPNGQYVYVLNELACTLEAYLHDPESGVMTNVQTSPTLPFGYHGVNKAAAIDVHPSGKFVYVSNRGKNEITVFAVDDTPVRGDKHESGCVMAPVQHLSSGGDAPRFIGLDPTGNFLLSLNKKTHNIVVYRVDAETGKLTDTGFRAQVPWCMSVAFE